MILYLHMLFLFCFVTVIHIQNCTLELNALYWKEHAMKKIKNRIMYLLYFASDNLKRSVIGRL